jgi:uncharacterized protein YyaL (SSP411 family)
MTTPIRWRHFDPATIDAAVRSDRPILMVITAPWCQHCRELMATSLSDTRTVKLVEAAFVPVHVDAERRPDINQRFGTGGWPTIAWLTPGGELIAQDTFLDADALLQRLETVRAAWHSDKQDIKRRIAELWAHRDERTARRGARLQHEMVDDIADAIYGKFDHRHGGFGQSIRRSRRRRVGRCSSTAVGSRLACRRMRLARRRPADFAVRARREPRPDRCPPPRRPRDARRS